MPVKVMFFIGLFLNASIALRHSRDFTKQLARKTSRFAHNFLKVSPYFIARYKHLKGITLSIIDLILFLSPNDLLQAFPPISNECRIRMEKVWHKTIWESNLPQNTL